VFRVGTLPGQRVPRIAPPLGSRTSPALDTPGFVLRSARGLPVALATGIAFSSALAAGIDDAARLGALAGSSLAAAAGALLLAHRPPAAPAVALVLVPFAAIPALGVATPLLVVAGALLYVLYARRLAARTPFAILAAGGAAASFALAGWQAAESVVTPTPLLLAAVAFLWTPGHVWSSSLATDRDRGTQTIASLASLAGAGRAAAAVFATSAATVFASLLLVPRLPWEYAALAVPAGAILLAAALELRRRADPRSAARVVELSALYVVMLLAGLALTAL
jgi:protoheme IX farnesyltransferase